MRASKTRTKAVCALSLMLLHSRKKGTPTTWVGPASETRAYTYGGVCVSTERFKLRADERAASV